MSYTSSIYHVVWRTYRGMPVINAEHEKDLYRYIWGYCKGHDIKLYQVGGMGNHIHALVGLPPTLSLSSFMSSLKSSTSKWLKTNPNFPRFIGWASEYAGLSCGKERVPTIVNYIKNQKQHHQCFRLEQELRSMLVEQGVEIDERYFLNDD